MPVLEASKVLEDAVIEWEQPSIDIPIKYVNTSGLWGSSGVSIDGVSIDTAYAINDSDHQYYFPEETLINPARNECMALCHICLRLCVGIAYYNAYNSTLVIYYRATAHSSRN